jgi:hypothetical protein
VLLSISSGGERASSAEIEARLPFWRGTVDCLEIVRVTVRECQREYRLTLPGDPGYVDQGAGCL